MLKKSATAMMIGAVWTGFGCGYLSVFVTTAAESFGTNLRVTVVATVTNFMRGAITILIPFRAWLSGAFQLTLSGSLMVTGAIVFSVALIAAAFLHETYGKSLDFIEN